MSTYSELTNASNLTFDDEFNTFVSSPNGSSGWMTSYPWDGENARSEPQAGEAEYYSDPSVGTNPFTDVNGVLNINASVATPGSNPYDLPYTSGIITSYKSLAQTYGYFEIRAELPAGQGLWPAFWLDPVAFPTTSELDVFEVLGNAPTTLYSSTHTWPVDGTSSQDSQRLTVANTSTGFNTYGVDWEPTTVTFYMNGQVIATAPTPSTMNLPMYMLANLAVGGPTSWPGAPSSDSEFPADYKIDYIRAYATAATTEVTGTQAILTSGITGQLLLAGRGSSGATVKLESASGVVIQTAQTSASGSFSFTGLSAGDYRVLFVPSVGQTLASGGPADATTGLTSTLTLTDGQTLTLAAESLTSSPGATTPITITPGTEAVTTTDAAATKPFGNVVINDANAGQTETATVSLSAVGNGTLSDPNSSTDYSTIANGVLTVSGSATTVAAALDGLLFTPSSSSAPTVTTTVTAQIKDTAGENALATSTIKATHDASPADTQVNGTAGTIYDTSGNAWTITTGGQIAENGTIVPSSEAVTTLFWTGTALDQLNTYGDWWTQPLNGSPGTELTAAPANYAPPTMAISITPATKAVATTDAASAKPFAGVVITDPNAGQTETATVSLSAAANGMLSDPNWSTDHSTITNGILTVSGSATAVSTALDGLVFTPTANQVAAGAAVATKVTAVIKDTAGETASAASTITATQVAASPTATDTIVLDMSEDYADGNADFKVSVNGQQVGGVYQVNALHSSGDSGTVSLTGDWDSGVNDVAVSFINHAYGRNLYVNSISENGVTYADTNAAFPLNGSDIFAVGGTTATVSGAADTLDLKLSEDAWNGNAEFVLYIDGKAVTTPQVVSALHDANQTQTFGFTGNLGAGTHTVGICFKNDAYGGSSSEDRNLYIDGVTLNGTDVFNGVKAQDSNGISTFSFATTH